MTTIHYDSTHNDQQRRERLYDGDFYVFSPTEQTLDFCRFARSMIENAFDGLDPERAQYDIPVRRYAQILGELKPAFIHHPKSKRHIQATLNSMGVDPARTHFEVPKMRTSTSDGYLTSGIAFAWHPHRDTWYSAAQCQINWWLPIYEIRADNTMTFYPKYWDTPVENSSAGYNYYEWNRKYRGAHVIEYLDEDPRPLPKPTEDIDTGSEVRLICPVGGIVLFSGAQLHASVENTSGKTRFSLDFRTVHLDDLIKNVGAPNIDSSCTGTVLNDFISAADLSGLPESVIAQFQDGTEGMGNSTFPAPGEESSNN